MSALVNARIIRPVSETTNEHGLYQDQHVGATFTIYAMGDQPELLVKADATKSDLSFPLLPGTFLKSGVCMHSRPSEDQKATIPSPDSDLFIATEDVCVVSIATEVYACGRALQVHGGYPGGFPSPIVEKAHHHSCPNALLPDSFSERHFVPVIKCGVCVGAKIIVYRTGGATSET